MRIHAMLALMARTQESQLQFCLDSVFFVNKIFDVCFKTMTQFDQNREKYSKIKENKENEEKGGGGVGGVPLPGVPNEKYVVPNTVGEWLKLQFSKEFIERTNKSEDLSFMGKFTFDRPEMTIRYVRIICGILEGHGMHVCTMPLYVLYRYLTKEILGSQYLTTLADAQFSTLLFKIGKVLFVNLAFLTNKIQFLYSFLRFYLVFELNYYNLLVYLY